MTPEQQRIAIAAACGELNPGFTESGSCIASTAMDNNGNSWGTHGVPDYLRDLNAMREVLMTIAPSEKSTNEELELWGNFERELNRVCLRDCRDGAGRDERQILATAAQKAEAILRTLNLWEP